MEIGNISSMRNTKVRDSNMELLRIVSMIVVLVVHASFKSFGMPEVQDVAAQPVSSFLRFLSESMSIICVNVFILISGWFGIRPKLSRFCEFLFQAVFFGFIIYIIMLVSGNTGSWHKGDWIDLFTFRRGLWFVNAYVILYIFAPILNMFAENATKRQLQVFLIAFFVFQTFWGVISSEPYYSGGYSPLSFMGLYLLARYARLFPNKYTTLGKVSDMAIYFAIILMTAVMAFLLVKYTGGHAWMFFHFSSPLVILSSFYFFLFFTKLSFRSHVVNWIASSAFAAYLLHCDPLLFKPHYLDVIKAWSETYMLPEFFLYVAGYIVLIFILAVLLDKIRIFVWTSLNWAVGKAKKEEL